MEDQIIQSKGLIKAIDKTSVHRLCSGQVVLTLATAVKELVENSLDAGATNITVRAVKSGLEMIEVSDNGSGVEEDNFQALTLKHYTSKIAEFNDLVDIETYGFRGEALSSLCALSKVTIITRSSSSEVGTKLSIDNGGKIISKSICPRQQGTTVMIEDIFSTLPVRRKELEKNIGREFGRMVNYISGYCLIRLGLKLTITNLLKNNNTAVLRVTGNNSVKGNIMDVFGVKQWSTLVEFAACDRPDEDILEELGISSSQDKISAFLQDLSIAGFLSSAEHGQGRSASDRQFFFINLRPFDCQKLTRLINEVYHSFNRNQCPFVVLDIRIATSCIDVNVTPDKRQVFLQNEKLLLAIIKTSLKRMYSSTPSICKSISSVTTPSRPARDSNSDKNDRSLNKKRNFSVAFESKSPSTSSSPSSSFLISSMKKQRTLDSFASTKSSSFASTKNRDDDNDVVIDKNDDRMITKHNDDDNRSCIIDCDKNTVITSNDNNNNDDVGNCAKTCSLNAIISDKNDIKKTNDNNDDIKPVPKDSDGLIAISHAPKVSSIIGPQLSISSFQNPSSKSAIGSFQNEKSATATIVATTKKSVKNHRPRKNRDDDDDGGDNDLGLIHQRKTKTVNFSLTKLKEKLQNREYDKRNSSKTSKDVERKFKAQIQPSDNDKAESELQRMISKDMFKKMEVLGQFNLGFIISRLGSDLFIIDQHASDEKFNFERLEGTVTLRNQKLIRPMRMELTACNESVLMENLKIFQKNGFEFAIDEEANLMDRIRLSSIPTSKNWTFGQQDVEEMIFMLTESPGVMCRPSRIRQMLASRACRSSVMIGTALNEFEMKKLVKHMGEINQPWNCPHGRPTIRHLIDLNMIEP